ncbi:MAG: hypothetical protein V4722_04450 [Bacteroidota bacterium]
MNAIQNITIEKTLCGTGNLFEIHKDGQPVSGNSFISESMASETAIKLQFPGVRPGRDVVEEFLQRIKKYR